MLERREQRQQQQRQQRISRNQVGISLRERIARYTFRSSTISTYCTIVSLLEEEQRVSELDLLTLSLRAPDIYVYIYVIQYDIKNT